MKPATEAMARKMLPKPIIFFQSWSRQVITFTVVICLVRIYEYLAIASKFFISNAFKYELTGLPYDISACLICSCIFLLPYLLLYLINKRLAGWVFHLVNVLLIIMYLAPLVVV